MAIGGKKMLIIIVGLGTSLTPGIRRGTPVCGPFQPEDIIIRGIRTYESFPPPPSTENGKGSPSKVVAVKPDPVTVDKAGVSSWTLSPSTGPVITPSTVLELTPAWATESVGGLLQVKVVSEVRVMIVGQNITLAQSLP